MRRPIENLLFGYQIQSLPSDCQIQALHEAGLVYRKEDGVWLSQWHVAVIKTINGRTREITWHAIDSGSHYKGWKMEDAISMAYWMDRRLELLSRAFVSFDTNQVFECSNTWGLVEFYAGIRQMQESLCSEQPANPT